MQEIIREYVDTKCVNCQNKRTKVEAEKCDIRIFQYNDYRYCKCCNQTSPKKEIKKKII